MGHATASRGFSLVELMVAAAVVGLMAVIATPSFGNATRSARERGVVQKLAQDFAWARGAATAGDAAAFGASSGAPTVVVTLKGDCSWTTTVNGVADGAHSLTPAQLAGAGLRLTCTATSPTLPAAFAFTPQGFLGTTGSVTYTGAGGQVFTLTILYSGSMLRSSPGTQS